MCETKTQEVHVITKREDEIERDIQYITGDSEFKSLGYCKKCNKRQLIGEEHICATCAKSIVPRTMLVCKACFNSRCAKCGNYSEILNKRHQCPVCVTDMDYFLSAQKEQGKCTSCGLQKNLNRERLCHECFSKKELKDLLCVSCKRPTTSQTLICKVCEKKEIKGHLCPSCKKNTAIKGNNVCEDCRYNCVSCSESFYPKLVTDVHCPKCEILSKKKRCKYCDTVLIDIASHPELVCEDHLSQHLMERMRKERAANNVIRKHYDTNSQFCSGCHTNIVSLYEDYNGTVRSKLCDDCKSLKICPVCNHEEISGQDFLCNDCKEVEPQVYTVTPKGLKM